ncbi:hypothetical protein RSPO_m00938 (plasmid) [Ralstonia solanacearum Po82]|uniref:Uncharacterized protein n=1 Tax=Ralstonia solanacearum (strain Po82) TaxID=1031711 RepID=F6G958_RALS8|nr:hypothetical protein RSPO_m00938 [Ralstonia solanacearum Po82]
MCSRRHAAPLRGWIDYKPSDRSVNVRAGSDTGKSRPLPWQSARRCGHRLDVRMIRLNPANATIRSRFVEGFYWPCRISGLRARFTRAFRIHHARATSSVRPRERQRFQKPGA